MTTIAYLIFITTLVAAAAQNLHTWQQYLSGFLLAWAFNLVDYVYRDWRARREVAKYKAETERQEQAAYDEKQRQSVWPELLPIEDDDRYHEYLVALTLLLKNVPDPDPNSAVGIAVARYSERIEDYEKQRFPWPKHTVPIDPTTPVDNYTGAIPGCDCEACKLRRPNGIIGLPDPIDDFVPQYHGAYLADCGCVVCRQHRIKVNPPDQERAAR